MQPPSEAGRFASKISYNPRRKAWVNPNLYGQRIRAKIKGLRLDIQYGITRPLLLH